jgi:hypothetical protein
MNTVGERMEASHAAFRGADQTPSTTALRLCTQHSVVPHLVAVVVEVADTDRASARGIARYHVPLARESWAEVRAVARTKVVLVPRDERRRAVHDVQIAILTNGAAEANK